MKKVILISGKAENGKSETAKVLKRNLEDIGFRVAIIPYAAYLKLSAKLIYGWDGNKDEAGRKLLQKWGTDIVREKDPDFWARTVVDLTIKAFDVLDYVIVDDVRFPNEISCWDNVIWPPRPFTVKVRVSRPGFENHLTPEQRNHVSETALDNYDDFDVILEATTKKELHEQVIRKLFPKVID